jgi:glycerol-3-phosphate dehydrogenase
VANYVQVAGFEHHDGRIATALVQDRLSGRELVVRASRVVNATGAWSGAVSALDRAAARAMGPQGPITAGPANGATRALRLSKGVHLVVDRDSLPLGPIAVVLPTTADGRLAFAVPWGRHVLLGTTDTPYEGDPAAVFPESADVAALLGDANRFLDVGLSEADVISAFAGLRPLVADEAATTATTSREHAVTVAPSGLVSVSGGKLTTYRRMARDTVDAALQAVTGRWGVSTTARIPVQGAAGLTAAAPQIRAQGRELGLSTGIATHLLDSYGADAACLLALVADRADLGRPLVPDLPYVRAEVVYGARYEGAQTLEDVLRRRTRVALEDRDGGLGAAADVADLLAVELGWSDERRREERDAYQAATLATRDAWQAR